MQDKSKDKIRQMATYFATDEDKKKFKSYLKENGILEYWLFTAFFNIALERFMNNQEDPREIIKAIKELNKIHEGNKS